MLRNITQIRLEKVSDGLNSLMFKQQKDNHYKDTKPKFNIASKTKFDEPLGQLSSLSSRDWVEKKMSIFEAGFEINKKKRQEKENAKKMWITYKKKPMQIHELVNAIDVHTPLGYGKAIAWLDYGSDTNTVWKVVLYEDGKVRNFYDDDIRVYPNKMDGGDLIIPADWKK
jgi:hypothetical protein